jgi:hypothetical protein
LSRDLHGLFTIQDDTAQERRFEALSREHITCRSLKHFSNLAPETQHLRAGESGMKWLIDLTRATHVIAVVPHAM